MIYEIILCIIIIYLLYVQHCMHHVPYESEFGSEKTFQATQNSPKLPDDNTNHQSADTFSDSSAQGTDQRSRVQNFVLIWVDSDIQPKDPDTHKQIEQVRMIVNEIFLIPQPLECMKFLQNLDAEKALVMSSESIGPDLVPRIHSMKKLAAIYIYPGNQNHCAQWSKQWTKIKGIHMEISQLSKSLRYATKQINQDSVSFSMIDINMDSSLSNLNRLEPSFMYTLLLKDTILKMKHDREEIQNVATVYKKKLRNNDAETSILKEFVETYRSDKSVWWYTREWFGYQVLNRALRLLEGDVIIEMGFFIHDIHTQLEQLHKEQLKNYGGKPLIVYRGQALIEESFTKLQKNKGGLLGFNCFLSTSKDHSISMRFAEYRLDMENTIGVLFVITVDPKINRTPFADVTEISFCGDESEVLFSMHTVFRINQIDAINNKNKLFEVHLSLTNDDDPELKALTVHLNKEIGGSGWERLASMLIDIGQVNEAEELYLTLLKTATSKIQKGSLNHSLGWIKYRQGNYQAAIQCYEQALSFHKEIEANEDHNLASSYNQIGQVYLKMSEYSKALTYFEQALAIDKKTLSVNHPSLAVSYHNLGGLYNNMKDYSKALLNYEQALNIQKETLPQNHPDLAISFNNLGVVHLNMGDYSKALFYYNNALNIQEKVLPDNHLSLAISYNNIASIYEDQKDYLKALELYRKALKIKVKSLPSNDPSILKTQDAIDYVEKQLKL